jgi:hypothetical protein
MRRIPLLMLFMGMLMLACSSGDNGNPDGSDQDGTVNEDGGGDSGDNHAPEVIDCVEGQTKCPNDLSCRCCGSIGPEPICICTAQCTNNEDCAGTGFLYCNMAEGAKSGICTPIDFNCCWDCQ